MFLPRDMESKRRSKWVYGLLLGLWLLIAGWQVEEHVRVERDARAVLVNRGKDISTTLSIVLRSQRRFGGVVSKETLEASLAQLVRQGKAELKGVALLNAAGNTVASAGTGFETHGESALTTTELWEDQSVAFVNPIDLGTNVTSDIERNNPTIILSRQDFQQPPPQPDERREGERGNRDERERMERGDNQRDNDNDGDRRSRSRFGRPRWMSEEDFQAIVEKQGVHRLVLVMSTESVHALVNEDKWLRSLIVLLATVSLAGSAYIWTSARKSSELQVRLIRASEMNTHLKSMNLAAAGLAHETRNPLNIIRGMAQMISKMPDSSTDMREKTRTIVDQTDKVTAQLNEFINYSRPRELNRANVAVMSVAKEVVRTLSYDVEEKKIQFEVTGEPLIVEADEQLLRQAIFNLVLNAIQAAQVGGHIKVRLEKAGIGGAVLEVQDDGPGVAPENREEIFKPYFTTHQKGTGLGLAVVQQIVTMHGWEIQCLANEPKGARFRIAHLKTVS
jgi:signal transduction histidine kinase